MKIDRKDESGGLVLVCALRYALGRHTYIPGHIIEELSVMLKDIPTHALKIIVDDIDSEIKMYKRTPSMSFAYEDKWLLFEKKVEKELEERVKEVVCT